jgi:hypothetical protein
MVRHGNRICAQPISIAEITGRPNGVSRAEASAEKNRELIRIEDQLAAQTRRAGAPQRPSVRKPHWRRRCHARALTGFA